MCNILSKVMEIDWPEIKISTIFSLWFWHMDRVSLSTSPRSAPSSAKQAGFSLIEVMVSVFLFAVGVLGMIALQSQSMGNSNSAMQRSLANILANDIVERMMANNSLATDGKYNRSLSTGSDLSKTPDDLVTIDLVDWYSSLTTWLPGGKGAVQCDSDGVCEITVQWEGQLVDTDSADDQDAGIKTLSMVTQI